MMTERTDFFGSNTPKCRKSSCSFQKTGCSFHSFEPILSKRANKKSPKNLDFSGFFGGELGIRTLGTFLYTAFRANRITSHSVPHRAFKHQVLPLICEKIKKCSELCEKTARNVREKLKNLVSSRAKKTQGV